MTTRTVELQLPANEAWEKLKTAASSIGRVEEVHDASRFLMVKARYGLNPVRLRVSVLTGPTGSTSVLDVQGRGQDVWGVASRKVIDRLCAEIEDGLLAVTEDLCEIGAMGGKTTERAYSGPSEQVFEAARRAVADLGYSVIHTDAAAATISFNTGRSFDSFAGQDLTVSVFREDSVSSWGEVSRRAEAHLAAEANSFRGVRRRSCPTASSTH